MDRSLSKMVRNPLFSVCLLGLVSALLGPGTSHASGPLNCSAAYQIREQFTNGAEWEMCWERRNLEGIVLSDVYYTTTTGARRKVYYQANVAQIHVPYDDDGARFHDVSDYGLGDSTHLNDLQPGDCPNGTLLFEAGAGKNVICKTSENNLLSSLTASDQRLGESVSLFSVSHVGAYNYIPVWTFFDDGTMEIAMGATGQLQRFGATPAYGWPVNTSANPIGISHLHNYYWRLDFDLVSGGADDVVEEFEFVAEDSTKRTRAKVVTAFNTETARSINSSTQRFWRIKDKSTINAEGAPISYDIVPLDTGHRDIGPTFEPFTFNDLYVTKSRACEKFASHNPADGPGGCVANADVSDFVNGESLVNQDPVIWFGITFHHIPRDEDEPYMHAHWNRFQIAPRDWTEGTTPVANSAPQLTSPGNQSGNVQDIVNLQLQASDPDTSDTLTFSASALPSSLSINPSTGLISGTLQTEGNYSVTAFVQDQHGASDSKAFSWSVGPRPNTAPSVTNPGPQSNFAGDFVSLQVVANDADNDPLTYTASNLPPGLGIGLFDGQIGGQITQAGSYSSTVTVSDGFGGITDSNFSWSVNAPPGNVAPIVTNPGAQESSVGDAVSLAIQAIDVNGDTLRYLSSNLPAGLTIDPDTGVISGSPSASHSGTVTVTVDDQVGGQTPVSFSWTVYDGVLLNISPVGMGMRAKDSAGGSGYVMYTAERMQSRFTHATVDPNAAEHLVLVKFANGNWKYATDTKFVAFTPRADDLLVAAVSFPNDTVTYLAGTDSTINGILAGYVDSDVVITPNVWNGSANPGEFGLAGTYILANNSLPPPPNAAPVLVSPGDQFDAVDDVINLQLSASDAEFDPITYTATGLPPTLSLNTSTGRISGTLTAVGSYAVTLSVSDTNGGLDSAQITWNVAPAGSSFVNIGPVGRGIKGKDNATGSGYAMYTEERMQTRFTAPAIDPNSADHVIAVRYFNGSWQYINDSAYTNFVPRPTDLLIAVLDFSADTVTMLAGTNSVVNGIQSGYASGDVVITPNLWNGNFNLGEFGIAGTSIVTN